MLYYDRRATAVRALVETDYRLRVVMERVPAEELDAAGGQVAVDLRGHQHGHVVLPGHVEQDLGLPYEVVPDGAVVVSQAVVHRQGVYDHRGHGPGGSQLSDLVHAVRLLLEAVDLEHQEALHGVLHAGEDLGYAVGGQPLGVYVRYPLSALDDAASQLEADVGLARSCLAVDQRHAASLDASAEETVELLAAQGYPLHRTVNGQ